MVGRASAAHRLDDRAVDEVGDPLGLGPVEPGHRRVAAHAAGVRALVAVIDPLVVLGRGEGEHVLARRRGRAARAPRPRGTPRSPPRCRRSAAPRRRPPIASRASASVAQMITPLPAASPSAFSTDGIGRAARSRRAPPRGSATPYERPSARPASSMSSLACSFDPSSRAASPLGPNAAMPVSLERIDEPGDQRRLGADDDQVDLLSGRGPDEPVDVLGADVRGSEPPRRSRRCRARRAAPVLCGERPSAWTIACSRPPPPTTRTLKGRSRSPRRGSRPASGCSSCPESRARPRPWPWSSHRAPRRS